MEISETEYKKFLADQTELENSKKEIAKLKSTAENTAIALSKHRDTEKALNAKISELETENDSYKTDIEEKYKNFDDISEKAKLFEEKQAKEIEDRKNSIEELKTKLGDKFTDDHKDFIDGLDDNKVEKYLTGLLPKEENKNVADLRTGDDKDKKNTNKGNRLAELEKNKDNLSVTEKLEYISLAGSTSEKEE